jgi:hypothetical protein
VPLPFLPPAYPPACRLPLLIRLQIVSLAGSAGGQEATPPTDRATAILLGLNGATERDSLSNLFPLDNAEGKLPALPLQLSRCALGSCAWKSALISTAWVGTLPLPHAGVEAACQFINSERGVPGSKANDTTTNRQLSAVVNYVRRRCALPCCAVLRCACFSSSLCA